MTFYTNVSQRGNSIYVRGIDNGLPFRHSVDFKPTLYIPDRTGESEWKTLHGVAMQPVVQGSINDAKEFIASYEGVSGFEIQGNTNYIAQYINEVYKGTIEYDPSLLRVIFLDIETTVENGFPDVNDPNEEILLISIHDRRTKEKKTFSAKYHEGKNIIHCSSEADLLGKFVTWWATDYPDAFTGWNCKFFDMAYMCARIERVLGESFVKRLSPWNRYRRSETKIMNNVEVSYDLEGVACLDYLDLYKKFTYSSQESYKLDHIAYVELGRKKLNHDEFATFKDFYTRGWKKFVDYNIIDVELVVELDEKMQLIDLAATLAYKSKMNYEDVFSAIRLWDNLIYSYLCDQKIVVPDKAKSFKGAQFEGAFVMQPTLGFKDWGVSVDAESLYPTFIEMLNISPETYRGVQENVDVNHMLAFRDIDTGDGQYCVGANGAMFDKSKKGMLPSLIEAMKAERKAIKKRMLGKQSEKEQAPADQKAAFNNEIASLNNQQMAIKIAMNSLFGALGNQYFRYFELECARAITMTGQFVIQRTGQYLEERLQKLIPNPKKYVFYEDTDSIYFEMAPFVKKFCEGKTDEEIVNFLDKIMDAKVQPWLDTCSDEIFKYTNSIVNRLYFKRESIFSVGFWTAKKRYAILVHDSEGVRYAKPKLKIMGLEVVKSSTPEYARDALRECLELVMKKDESVVQAFVKNLKTEFVKRPPEEIAFPRSANNMASYTSNSSIYSKGCPIQVRAALLYNHHLNRLKLEERYSVIKDGSKIKFAYLKLPNTIHEDIIGWSGVLPPEMGLHKYIDYETMFEKVFVAPLEKVLESIGWSVEEVSSLDALFD